MDAGQGLLNVRSPCHRAPTQPSSGSLPVWPLLVTWHLLEATAPLWGPILPASGPEGRVGILSPACPDADYPPRIPDRSSCSAPNTRGVFPFHAFVPPCPTGSSNFQSPLLRACQWHSPSVSESLSDLLLLTALGSRLLECWATRELSRRGYVFGGQAWKPGGRHWLSGIKDCAPHPTLSLLPLSMIFLE